MTVTESPSLLGQHSLTVGYFLLKNGHVRDRTQDLPVECMPLSYWEALPVRHQDADC